MVGGLYQSERGVHHVVNVVVGIPAKVMTVLAREVTVPEMLVTLVAALN